jgi:putative peptidoglycan lipid II flippase
LAIIGSLEVDAQAAQGRASNLHVVSLRRILVGESNAREATVMLMASFVLSAVLGSVQQVLVNAEFGAGSEASAFYAALRLRDLFFALIAGRVVSSALIPVLASHAGCDGAGLNWRLTDLVLTSLLAALALLLLVGEFGAPVIVSSVLAPGFDPETRQLTIQLTRIVLVQPLVLAVSAVAIAVLNHRNQFFLTSLSLACHNVGMIGGVLATWVLPSLGIIGPALGVIAGAVLQLLILLPGLRGLHFRYRPRWDPGDHQQREVIQLLVPTTIAAGLAYAGFIVDTGFASVAREPDAVPAIYNAWLLVGFPVALLGKAIGQSVFPRLARHAAEHDWTSMRRTLVRAMTVAVLLAAPATVALIMLGRQTIHVLFEHGRFDVAAGSLTYSALATYALGLPAYVALEVVIRGLLALRDTRVPLLADMAQLIGRAVIVVILIQRVGVLAVPAAYGLSAAVETMILGAMLLRRIRHFARASLITEEKEVATLPSVRKRAD